jgi:hypothetical protein
MTNGTIDRRVQQDLRGDRIAFWLARDPKLRERMKKILFFTTSNVSSVQHGGIGAPIAGGNGDLSAGAAGARFLLRQPGEERRRSAHRRS